MIIHISLTALLQSNPILRRLICPEGCVSSLNVKQMQSNSHCNYPHCTVESHYISIYKQCCGKSKILGRPTDHPWLMVGWSVSVLGGPSIIYWDHEMIKSIKELFKIRQSVFTLYSDTSTNRHTDALAMEILQSCIKPWIWYQCICGVVCPLFFRNIFCKT